MFIETTLIILTILTFLILFVFRINEPFKQARVSYNLYNFDVYINCHFQSEIFYLTGGYFKDYENIEVCGYYNSPYGSKKVTYKLTMPKFYIIKYKLGLVK